MADIFWNTARFGAMLLSIYSPEVIGRKSQDVTKPFNIASYAVLTHRVAHQARLQLSRAPHPLPRLILKRKPDSLCDYRFEAFEIEDYQAHDPIRAPISV